MFCCDSGSFVFRLCKYIFDTMNAADIWVSDIPLIEKEWSKPQVFNALGANEDEIIDSNQIQASFIGVRKTEYAERFIALWLKNVVSLLYCFLRKGENVLLV